MQTKLYFRQIVTFVICAALTVQQTAIAAQPNVTVIDGVKIHQDLKNVVTDHQGSVKGGIVDRNGVPVANADIVVGQKGEVVTTLKTDAQGRYTVKDLRPGIYQFVSFAGLQTYQVWSPGTEPVGSAKGIVQVLEDRTILRGAGCCDDPGCDGACGSSGGSSTLTGLLKNPLVWAVVIAAAIVLPLALDDDDAS